MCTLAAYVRVSAEVPLLVAANRDELLDRPSAEPRLIASDPGVVAGQDLGDLDEGDFRVTCTRARHELHRRIAMAKEDLGGGPLAFLVDLDGVARLRIEATRLDGNVSRHLGRDAASTERCLAAAESFDPPVELGEQAVGFSGETVVLALGVERVVTVTTATNLSERSDNRVESGGRSSAGGRGE